MELYQLFYYPSLAIFVVLLYKWLRNKERRFQLDHQIQKRRNEREAQFEKIEKYSSSVTKQRADEIAKWSFTELRENLRSGSVSCEDVLKAYQQKAIRADQKTNCVCLFIEESMKIAQSLDEKAKSSTYVKPALFGVPVSIKECIKIKGMDSTLGYAQDLFKPSEDNAIIVKQLIDFGAVPFVHTNVPLSLCSYGCTNAVYGATGNPLDISRVPGGSSGGEAALIADGGSILGIGTDVGGSIRSPAHFCGISGFKPSCRRFSHLGCAGGVPGRQLIVANEGPMAKDIDTCIEYLKLAWGDNFLSSVDPYVPPVLWQQKQFSSTEKLTIGYYTNDDFIQAAPGNERVVVDCVKILRSLGHKMVPFSVPDGQRAFELLAATVAADGGKFLNDRMDKDLVLPESDFNFVSRRLPLRVQRLIGKVLPWKRIGGILQALPINCEEQRKIFAEVEAYRHTFVKQMMDNDIDVIICPTMALYPPEHDVPSKLLPATNYTSLYNLLDFAAGTVPMTKVTKEDDIALDQYPENDPFDRKIKQQCKDMIGFPIGIQVAAPPYREEMALRILKQLSSHTSI